MTRMNCWDHLKCNREQECPAYPDNGRNCFAVTSTLCRGETQGDYDEKISQCRKVCAFYQQMMQGDA